ncbi:MAG: CoA-binding protein, partial [archaeon GB-1845-036]|nr:CoA-binding protein [Candidatus Culexmicrobium thermophilum]
MFNPRGVAIIGASRKPGKIGHEILKNIIEYGYKGEIYPINPKADEILGKKVYKSILEVPGTVDLAIIVIPAKFVAEVLEECGKKGVKAVAVISSGFGEVGKHDMEEEIVEISKKYGMRLLGPNIFGLFYAPTQLNATFGPKDILQGNIAFITQSGALGIALMGWTILENIGLSAIVSVGNKADIDDDDLLEYFSKDEKTKIILIYMEGVKNGPKFIKIAKEVTKNKPIIVLKAGRSKRGAMAAASHTGSLAGSDTIYSAAFKQT